MAGSVRGWSSAAALRFGFALVSPGVKVRHVIDDVPCRQCVGPWATVPTVAEPPQGVLGNPEVFGCLSCAVSAASLAKMQGWQRDTVGKALRELAQAGWLVVRTHKTAEGKRVFDEYHVHASRKFTEAEAATLSQPVIPPTAAHDGGTPLPTEQATSCLPERHPPAYGVGTKENQPEHQPEEKQEHQASESKSDCWGCRELGPGCLSTPTSASW
jgi:hypothetical protein